MITHIFKQRRMLRFMVLLSGCLIAGAAAIAQDTLTLTGRITGGQGRAVSEVAVSIEGIYQSPVITDTTGRFMLVSTKPEGWLLISPARGYKSRRVYINRQQKFDIQLTPLDMESGYDEVGFVFDPAVTRNIQSAVNVLDLQKGSFFPNESVNQSLQGQIQGLYAENQSGAPGTGVSIFLRGMRSMYTTNQPLYIIDDLPLEDPGLFQSMLSGYSYSPEAGLAFSDVTSMIVLKDYQSAALYGMRGSNGVVLIETLKPSEVQTTIDFSYGTGLSFEPNQIPQLDSRQYKTLANEVLMSSGMVEEEFRETYSPLYVSSDDPGYYRYNHQTNWQDEVFRNALMNDFYLRVRGGDEIARYGLSVSYLDQNGVIKETDFNRFGVRFVGTFNLLQRLRMYISSNLVSSGANIRESALVKETSPILTSLAKPPFLFPYQFDINGNQLETLEEVNSLGVSNPRAVINKFEGVNKNYRFTTSLKAEISLWEDYLQWTSMIGINFNAGNESVFMPNTGMELYNDNEAWNISKSLKNYLKGIYSDNYLRYRQGFRERHEVTAVVGFRSYRNIFEIDWGLTKNSHERDEYKQLQNGVSYLRELGGQSANWNRLGIYSSAGYTFRNKYFVNATLTTEYSSRIGENALGIWKIGKEPFGVFYSLGGAWRLSGEPFLRSASWLEDLRIRVSYGKTGNDDIGNLSAFNYYTVVHYREASGLVTGTLTDQSLKHETNRMGNVGVTASLFANRIHLETDLYRTLTEDLFLFEPQPTYTGFSTVPANNGVISNTGWETGLGIRFIDHKDFTWDFNLKMGSFVNEVLDIKDGEVITPFKGGRFISRTGEPVLSFYGYEYNGVFTTSEEATAVDLKTDKGISFGAGDAKFADLSGPDGVPDGIINELDMIILGSPIPELFGGISNSFRYGRWSLNATIQFVVGREVFNYLRFQNEKMTDLNNQSTYVLNRWTTEGQETEVPRALWGDQVGNSAFSSRWIEDGSYIRIKHLVLAYTIPDKMLFFRNMEIYIAASNLFTWTRYLGYDPEFSFSYNIMEQGIDYGMMPQTRRITFGVKLGL